MSFFLFVQYSIVLDLMLIVLGICKEKWEEGNRLDRTHSLSIYLMMKTRFLHRVQSYSSNLYREQRYWDTSFPEKYASTLLKTMKVIMEAILSYDCNTKYELTHLLAMCTQPNNHFQTTICIGKLEHSSLVDIRSKQG